MAAGATAKSKTALGGYARRMSRALRDRQHPVLPTGRLKGVKARLGKAEGIVATAHKLARILYAMITQQKPCDPAMAAHLTPARQVKLFKNLQTRAAALGMQLIEL